MSDKFKLVLVFASIIFVLLLGSWFMRANSLAKRAVLAPLEEKYHKEGPKQEIPYNCVPSTLTPNNP